MFGLPIQPDENGAYLPSSKSLAGTRDRAVNKGPSGTDSLLRSLFTVGSRPAEAQAYERLHTGNGGFGVSTMTLHGQSVFPHPDTGFLVPTGAGGKVVVLDGEVLSDFATRQNEQREYLKKLFSSLFTSDEILEQCVSADFVDACKKNKPDAAGALGKAMPAELRGVSCLPSVLFFLPENSESWALGVAKAAWLLQNHPDMAGRLITGGMPRTHGTSQRSGRSALEEAVA